MGVGTQIKLALRERKMTIKDLASKADVSLNTLYSITKRDSQRVDRVILQRIADALEVTPEYLTDEIELKGRASLGKLSLCEKILECADAANISCTDLCIQLGLPFDEWTRWGEYPHPSFLDYLPQIANILDVPRKTFQQYLDGTYLNADNVRESELLEAFNLLNSHGKDIAIERIHELCKIEDYIN